jgi:hypothetical protein
VDDHGGHREIMDRSVAGAFTPGNLLLSLFEPLRPEDVR